MWIFTKKCCFCLSLEAGTKVISVLSMMCSLVTVAVYAGAAGTVPAAAYTKQCVYVLAAVVAFCHAVVSILLFYGAFWSKPSYLWPWLVTSWVSCGGLLLLSLLGVLLLTLQYYQDVDSYADITTMSTFYFVYAVIIYYCAVVVRSRRGQMIRAEETESADTLMRHQHDPKNVLV